MTTPRGDRCGRVGGRWAHFTRLGLRLAYTKTSSTSVVIATYERAGNIGYGVFALDEPTAAEVERR